jgi:hypothetical protein
LLPPSTAGAEDDENGEGNDAPAATGRRERQPKRRGKSAKE